MNNYIIQTEKCAELINFYSALVIARIGFVVKNCCRVSILST